MIQEIKQIPLRMPDVQTPVCSYYMNKKNLKKNKSGPWSRLAEAELYQCVSLNFSKRRWQRKAFICLRLSLDFIIPLVSVQSIERVWLFAAENSAPSGSHEYSVCSLLSAHNSPGAGLWRPVNVADVTKETVLISFLSFKIYIYI